jgi:hypothetical protein
MSKQKIIPFSRAKLSLDWDSNPIQCSAKLILKSSTCISYVFIRPRDQKRYSTPKPQPSKSADFEQLLPPSLISSLKHEDVPMYGYPGEFLSTSHSHLPPRLFLPTDQHVSDHVT